jgi:hypothetical protein
VITALGFLVMLLATLIGTFASESPIILVATGVALLSGTIIIVRSAASEILATKHTLCVLFFSLGVGHICLGYILADLTTEHTSILSNAGVFYSKAMLINSIGIFAGAIGYAWKLRRQGVSAIRGFPMAVNRDLAEKFFLFLSLAGSALMFFAYWKLGAAEFLSQPTKWPFMRYVTSDLLGGSATDEWLVNRAMDLLTVSLPFILNGAAKRPRPTRILAALIGSVALLLPLRRANLLAVLLVLLVLVGIERRTVYQLTRKAIAYIAVLYLISQCIFLIAAFEAGFTPLGVLTVSSTALPEVRDLGWTLSLLNGESLDGTTFIQALIPLPSIVSDWSSAHSLRAISTKLIGLDETGQTGGLRLTIMGEGYINFGYLGVIAVGFLWGLAVGWCEKLLRKTGGHKPALLNYGAALCFVWICFLGYLAGTQAAASIKVGTLLLFGVAWTSQLRFEKLPAGPSGLMSNSL